MSLVIGILLSIRAQFKAGALFFFIILLNRLLYSSGNAYLRTLMPKDRLLFPNLSIGAHASLLALITNLIEVIGYIILIVGIYKLFKEKIQSVE